MDRMLYVAMNGAKQNMLAQTANTNNLANVSTPGFRADYASFRSMPVFGLGHPTRVYSMAERPGIDLNPGGLNTTGNPLDVAVDGDGYIAVQAKDGNEAFTRAGNLRITATGLMITAGGEPVLGNAGPISLPPAKSILLKMARYQLFQWVNQMMRWKLLDESNLSILLLVRSIKVTMVY